MEEFLTRFGDVATGAFFLIVAIAVTVVMLIELIDFLIVDPIKRSHQKTDEDLVTEED